MRILFLSGKGRDKTLAKLLDTNHIIQGLVVASGPSFFERSRGVVEVAVEYGLPIHPVPCGGVAGIVSQYSPDVVVSCGFPYILSKTELESAPCAINVHPSLLPKYRGYRSGPYVLINGEDASGVTVHFMNEETDAGDIILQKSFPLSKFDTTKSVTRKCLALEPEVLLEALDMLESGTFEAIAQDETSATTYQYMRKPEDSKIDWEKPLCQLFDEIRACDPDAYPAFFMVGDQKVCIRLWRPDKTDDELDMI